MPSTLQESILKDIRRRPLAASALREKYGRSVYAAITALEARGSVAVEWDTSEYPARKIVRWKE